jgi:hypothetical protein
MLAGLGTPRRLRLRMAVAQVAIRYASSEPVPQQLIIGAVCSAPGGRP